MGNELSFESTCELTESGSATGEEVEIPIEIKSRTKSRTLGDASDKGVVDMQVLTEEKLHVKQFNLITKEKSAQNIFYYEVYSQPM